jgi:hypothetical protein
MAALLLILGIAIVVLSRYFTADYTASHRGRDNKAIIEAEKELQFYFVNYRLMPAFTSKDIGGAIHTDKSFMVYDEQEELNRVFNPQIGLGDQLMYMTAQKQSKWNGDICSVFVRPSASPQPSADNFSVQIIYCEEALNLSGLCDKVRYKIDGLLYVIVHPGEDRVFSSKITGNTLYFPLTGNDDLVRYMTLNEAYDRTECSVRTARIPRQDKRYTNRDMKPDAASYPNTSPPIIRTYSTVDENTKSPSVCEVPKPDLHTSLLLYVPCQAIDVTEGGTGNSRYSSCKVRFDAIKCQKSHVEYPLNRFGESFPYEKCCLEVDNSSAQVNANAAIPMISNCALKFKKDGESCGSDESGWKDLKGETPYLEFFSSIVGVTEQYTKRNDNPLGARLYITLANGNKVYRLNDNATIHRVPPYIPD